MIINQVSIGIRGARCLPAPAGCALRKRQRRRRRMSAAARPPAKREHGPAIGARCSAASARPSPRRGSGWYAAACRRSSARSATSAPGDGHVAASADHGGQQVSACGFGRHDVRVEGMREPRSAPRHDDRHLTASEYTSRAHPCSGREGSVAAATSMKSPPQPLRAAHGRLQQNVHVKEPAPDAGA
jgi:hypothetical protein